MPPAQRTRPPARLPTHTHTHPPPGMLSYHVGTTVPPIPFLLSSALLLVQATEVYPRPISDLATVRDAAQETTILFWIRLKFLRDAYLLHTHKHQHQHTPAGILPCWYHNLPPFPRSPPPSPACRSNPSKIFKYTSAVRSRILSKTHIYQLFASYGMCTILVCPHQVCASPPDHWSRYCTRRHFQGPPIFVVG